MDEMTMGTDSQECDPPTNPPPHPPSTLLRAFPTPTPHRPTSGFVASKDLQIKFSAVTNKLKTTFTHSRLSSERSFGTCLMQRFQGNQGIVNLINYLCRNIIKRSIAARDTHGTPLSQMSNSRVTTKCHQKKLQIFQYFLEISSFKQTSKKTTQYLRYSRKHRMNAGPQLPPL